MLGKRRNNGGLEDRMLEFCQSPDARFRCRAAVTQRKGYDSLFLRHRQHLFLSEQTEERGLGLGLERQMIERGGLKKLVCEGVYATNLEGQILNER